MKKFGKVLLALVVVGLVISFVGCAMLGGNTDDLKKNHKWEFDWTGSNDGEPKFTRFYSQFGTSEKVTKALVEIKADKPENGWSGMVFGLTKNPTVEGVDIRTVNFFIIGTRLYDNGVNYYISYFKDVNPKDIQNEESFGTETELVTTKKVPASWKLNLADDGSLTTYVSLAVEGKNLVIKAGGDKENLADVITIDASEYMEVKDDKEVKVGIGAYGQITTGTEDEPKTVKTHYLVLESDPLPEYLSAVEE